MSTTRVEGIFDRLEFPEQLVAHVVDIGDGVSERRIAGYAVESDLAVQPGFLATAFLALRGELPTASELEAFSTALTLLAPTSVTENAGHVAVLARVTAAADEVLGAVIATAVGQATKAELVDHAGLCAFVDGAAAAPLSCLTTDSAAVDRYDALTARSQRWFPTPLPSTSTPTSTTGLTRVATAWAVLAKLQFRSPLELHGLSLLARLPVLFGEARHVVTGSVTRYPTRTPDHHYVEEQR